MSDESEVKMKMMGRRRGGKNGGKKKTSNEMLCFVKNGRWLNLMAVGTRNKLGTSQLPNLSSF